MTRILISGNYEPQVTPQAAAKFQRIFDKLYKSGYVEEELITRIEVSDVVTTDLLGITINDDEYRTKESIQILMLTTDLHLLPCWQQSKTATLLRDIAIRLNIPVTYH
jgi:hypothetical protein